jgi:hypothetical protein
MMQHWANTDNTALTQSILLTIRKHIFGLVKPDFINISVCQSYQYTPQTINIIVNIQNIDNNIDHVQAPLVISRMCSLLVIKFSFVRHVENLSSHECSQFTQHLRGSKHTVFTVCLKDWPGRQSLLDEYSATSSSSGPSKSTTFATDLHKAFVCRHTTF